MELDPYIHTHTMHTHQLPATPTQTPAGTYARAQPLTRTRRAHTHHSFTHTCARVSLRMLLVVLCLPKTPRIMFKLCVLAVGDLCDFPALSFPTHLSAASSRTPVSDSLDYAGGQGGRHWTLDSFPVPVRPSITRTSWRAA